jgi:hypothetical protein
MKLTLSILTLALGVTFGAAKAEASVGYCSIQANIQIDSAHILVGGSRGYGKGEILCTELNGFQYNIPVIVRTKSFGIGLGASSTQALLSSAGIGVMESGYDLLGKYAMVKGSAQVINLGADVGVSLTANRNGFSLPLDLKMKAGPGLELAVNIGSMTIEYDREEF